MVALGSAEVQVAEDWAATAVSGLEVGAMAAAPVGAAMEGAEAVMAAAAARQSGTCPSLLLHSERRRRPP
jgi:hypothetical protein